MNNKYQDALNKIIRSCCSYCDDDNGCQNCKIKRTCNATAKSWINTLQELIDKETECQSLEKENQKLKEAIKILEDFFIIHQKK